MSEKPLAESGYLLGITQHLERLVRDPNALRNDGLYGKPWIDAINDANEWLQTVQRTVVQELKNNGLQSSGKATQRLIQAEFDTVEKKLAGFFAARKATLVRRDEIQQTLAETEARHERVKRIREEVARLEQAVAAPLDDEEYGAAIRVVQASLDVTNKTIRNRCGRMPPAEKRVVDMMTAEQGGLADTCMGRSRAILSAEVLGRLEAARIELHKALNAKEPPKTKTSPSASDAPAQGEAGWIALDDEEITLTDASRIHGIVKSTWTKAANLPITDVGHLPTRKSGRNRYVTKKNAAMFAENYLARQDARLRMDLDSTRGN